MPHPPLTFGNPGPLADQLARLLAAARTALAAKDIRAAAAALSAAHALARHHNLHREAAQFSKAMAILSSGGKPKLLTRLSPSDPS